MIQVVKNKPYIKYFASVEFIHKKSNFYVFVRSRKKLVAQLSCGSVIGYNKKSSKRQKIKHVSEQLAEVSASKVNSFFHRRKRPLHLKFDARKIYNKLGLRSSFLRLLTERQKNRNVYEKIMMRNFKRSNTKKNFYSKWKIPRTLNYMPSLLSLYMIATMPFIFRRKKTRNLRRYRRLKKKYAVVFLRKFEFDKKRARSLFFRFVFKKRYKRRKMKYYSRVKIKKLL